jgi:hypothetical protein
MKAVGMQVREVQTEEMMAEVMELLKWYSTCLA